MISTLASPLCSLTTAVVACRMNGFGEFSNMRNNHADFDCTNIAGFVLREKLKTHFICIFCFALVSCSPKQHSMLLQIVPVYENNALMCQNIHIPVQSGQTGKSSWQIDNLAFFLSDIRYESQNKKTPVYPDSFYTGNASSVALVRLDTGLCNANIKLTSDTPFKTGEKLSFNLGVPFELNHLNPVIQPSPLNEPDMFWTWRNGYKFLRLDMRTGNQVGESVDSWAYHLGSVGCVSASAVRSPKEACAKPNLARFEMVIPENAVNPGHFKLLFHLDRLMQDVLPTRANRCVMHGEREPVCDVLYRNVSAPQYPVLTLEQG